MKKMIGIMVIALVVMIGCTKEEESPIKLKPKESYKIIRIDLYTFIPDSYSGQAKSIYISISKNTYEVDLKNNVSNEYITINISKEQYNYIKDCVKSHHWCNFKMNKSW